MVDITKLNIKYVNDNGFYSDYDKGDFFRLSDEEIIELRRYHNNRLIAKNRVRVKNTNFQVTVYNKDLVRRKKRLKRNKRKSRIIKRWIRRNGTTLIISVAIGVVLTAGLIFNAKGLTRKGSTNIGLETSTSDDKRGKSSLPSNNKGTSLTFKGDVVNDEETFIGYEDEVVNDEEQEIKEIIRKYCDIYNVNYDIVYDWLVNMTDNFSSDDFYEGRIDGIRCKGADVEADSNEELLIYAIRHIKQLPEDFGLTKEDLYVDSNYVDSKDYFAEIKYYSRVFGLDECLIAAIVQSETGFDSDLFNNINNPAGLRVSKDEWWAFDNKAQGFIELCLEIRKYYSKIGYSHFEVNDDIIALIGDEHAPKEDNNIYWLGNVISNYHMYLEHYAEYFSIDSDSNKISL